jgi:hypothetical protein
LYPQSLNPIDVKLQKERKLKMKTKFLFYIGSVIIFGVVVFLYNAVDNSLTEEYRQYIPKFLVGIDPLPEKFKFKDELNYISAVQKTDIGIAPHYRIFAVWSEERS